MTETTATLPEFEPIIVEQMRGVRTRWETTIPENYTNPTNSFAIKLAAMDKRASVVPNLGNFWLEHWANKLIELGANVAELNLDPRIHLSKPLEKKGLLPDTTLQQYKTAYYVAHRHREPIHIDRINAAREYIQGYAFTPEQRDELLLHFLQELEDLRKANKLGPDSGSSPVPFQFLLHQRQWFTSDHARREERVDEFVQDMSDFINKARMAGVGRWIGGIRLGEHYNADMFDFLPLLVDLAKKINAKTGDWLKTRLFLANGGGHGAEFLNIHLADMSYDFFPKMYDQTRSFAFGYKWMQFNSPTNEKLSFISNWMQAYYRDPEKGIPCDVNSKDDWKLYLREGLGFDHLQYVINHSKQSAYPNHAHVVFVGDSSDSLKTMTTLSSDGLTLEEKAPLQAVRELFDSARGEAGQFAARWNGRHFCQFSTSINGFDTDQDAGFSLLLGDETKWGYQATERPLTMEKWKNWPPGP